MAFPLVGGDSEIKLSIGQAADGTTPNYGATPAPGNITGYCRHWSVRETVRTVNVAAPSSTREKHRVLQGSTTITIEDFVLSTGSVGYNMVGHYAKVEIKEKGTMSTFKTYEGIITVWELSSGDAEQVERIEVLCDASYG